jgi:hypothetical protein
MVGVQIPTGARDFSLQNVQTGCGTHLAYFMDTRVKQLEHDVDCSSPASTKVKNGWSYTSAPPVCLHSMGRDNTFYFICGLNK